MNSQLTSILKKSDLVKGLVYDMRKIYRPLLHRKKKLVEDYFAQNDVPKLHIGAGHVSHPGWLNTDIEPRDKNVIYLDMTKHMKFPDETFSYIYSEHNIEHVPYADGLNMLRECRRILKPNGVFRLATPDLDFLLSLNDEADDERKEYIAWSAKFSGIEPTATAVINNAFRAWGHQFLYDAGTLERALRLAGFKNVARENYNESRHAPLRGIERHGANIGNVPLAKWETMIFEAW